MESCGGFGLGILVRESRESIWWAGQKSSFTKGDVRQPPEPINNVSATSETPRKELKLDPSRMPAPKPLIDPSSGKAMSVEDVIRDEASIGTPENPVFHPITFQGFNRARLSTMDNRDIKVALLKQHQQAIKDGAALPRSYSTYHATQSNTEERVLVHEFKLTNQDIPDIERRVNTLRQERVASGKFHTTDQKPFTWPAGLDPEVFAPKDVFIPYPKPRVDI